MTDVQASDGTSLWLNRVEAEGSRGDILVIHGYGEHGGRYRWAADRWRERGWSTTTIDLRGHGKSGGPRGHVQRFEDYHKDVRALLDHVRREGVGPRFLFGHSMGGLLALHWLGRRGVDGFAGLALSSPYLGLQFAVPGWKKSLAKVMSGIAPRFAQPAGLTGSDVAADPDIAAFYDRDPLNNKAATARWFTESQRAMTDVFASARAVQLPVLLLYAMADKVAAPSASARVAELLPRVQAEGLEGHMHELLNEKEPRRTEIVNRYADWFDEVAGRA